MKAILKAIILMAVGGMLYALFEIGFRGYTHWTMIIVGGICFYLIGLINEVIPWEMEIWKQCVIGSLVVTAVEFVSGCIINLWLGWGVWDYSDMPFNILGQVCLPFSALWVLLSALAIILDDYLRYWLYHEEKPHYRWR
ncbi:MAG: putative ABC transporter permease [Gallintestinimicrobium sp.]|jgi:uncharacterized membrane protein|uniref:putative ABC transporter permease n=1 Tax=Gallintestinimicrobium sp. TaxID=2981655 RepID=UPI003995D9F6